MSPKIKIIGFGSHGHVRKSPNHESDRYSGSPIMESKSYCSKIRQNNSTELSGDSLTNIYNNMSPQTPGPQNRTFLRISKMFYWTSFFTVNEHKSGMSLMGSPVEPSLRLRDHRVRLRDHQYGGRGGNRYVKGGIQKFDRKGN